MRILLADDHDLFRAGLSMVLQGLGEGIDVTQAASLSEAIAYADEFPEFDLALLDLNMPAMQGISGLRKFRQQFPGIPVVMVSASDSPADAQQALDAGASGYIHKSSPPQVVLSALQLVMAGGVYVPPQALLREAVEPEPHSVEKGKLGGLTARQLDVLRLLAEGKPNKLIARELGLSEGTVKIHLSTIFRVLDVNNRTEAVLAAQSMQLDLAGRPPASSH
jgi:DNA-binding NarL/FixJ family response regulator